MEIPKFYLTVVFLYIYFFVSERKVHSISPFKGKSHDFCQPACEYEKQSLISPRLPVFLLLKTLSGWNWEEKD